MNTVIGALETALVDLAAQRAGLPLWRFLGGAAAEPVPLYANLSRARRVCGPEELGAIGARAVDAGFRAVKCAPFDSVVPPSDEIAEGLRRLRAVREAVGPDVAVMVDVDHRLTSAAVLAALPVLEDVGVAWLENAVRIADPARLEDLAARTSIPLAGGAPAWDLDTVVRAVSHGLQVATPDFRHAGGFRRAQRMASAVAPAAVSFHHPSGPIGTLASGHLTLACPNARILGYAFGDVPWRPDCVTPAEQVAGGVLSLPGDRGLGARLVGLPGELLDAPVGGASLNR